jgi:hypothetical protein
MLGICPNCKIKLKDPPFNSRETNEVLLVLNYRKLVESKKIPKSIEETDYCELCNASKDDLKKQLI